MNDNHAEVSSDIAEEARDLSLGCASVMPEDGLVDKLKKFRQTGKPLRIKLGIDPSGRDLTLGHAVVLNKLRQFQDHGHVAVLIVGDFTGQIGDPTGRTETRRVLTKQETRENATTYMQQALKILAAERLELRYNSEWLEKMSMADVLRTGWNMTVARLLEREDFANRYSKGQAITLSEFMYPMLQGLDSVHIEADVELGGTDQTYNNLVGRALQKAAGQDGQIVMTVPLLRGTDGAEKMGKSLGNWISVNDSPDDQFGKVLSISDDLVTHYAELCCRWSAEYLQDFSARFERNPLAAKRQVAARIVELYHGREEAKQAEERFDARFRRRELPQDAEPFSIDDLGPKLEMIDLLCRSSLVSSRSEAKRMLQSGAIRLDGQKVELEAGPFASESLRGKILQRGKLRSVQLI